MAKESYNDLVFQLGDLARERLANRASPPRAMDRVLKAEEALVIRQQELQDLEGQMNGEDEAFSQFLADLEAERAEKLALVKRWGKAVEGILGKVKDLRKKIAAKKADLRYGTQSLKMADAKHADFEITSQDPSKVELSRQNLKKLRLGHMRQTREVEELEYQFNQAFEVGAGQPGAPGILAQKRMLEMEDEEEGRRAEHEAAMKEWDQAIATKEEELRAAEDYLDQALFLLGEECYAQRLADPSLAAFYPRLDKAK